MLNTIKISIKAEKVEEDMIKYVKDFINYKSPNAGELHIEIIADRENCDGKPVKVSFCNIFIQKIWNDYTKPEYVKYYDILGNYNFVKNSLVSYISEENLIGEINKIQEKITKKYNSESFLVGYAMSNYTDSRKYLYNNGRFCIRDLDNPTKEARAKYNRICMLTSEVLSRISNPDMSLDISKDYNEDDIPLLNFLKYLLIDNCNDEDIDIISSLINIKGNNNKVYKIPQLIVTTVFSSGSSKTAIYLYSKEEQVVLEKVINLFRKYMKKEGNRAEVKSKYFKFSTVETFQKKREEELKAKLKEEKEKDRYVIKRNKYRNKNF